MTPSRELDAKLAEAIRVTCVACGTGMVAEDDDPCPRLCSACFLAGMDRIDQEQHSRVFGSAREHAEWIHSAMLALGVTPAAILETLVEIVSDTKEERSPMNEPHATEGAPDRVADTADNDEP